jgi:hypothetical protein
VIISYQGFQPSGKNGKSLLVAYTAKMLIASMDWFLTEDEYR